MEELNKCDILKLPIQFQPPVRNRTAYTFFIKANYRRYLRWLQTRDPVQTIRALGQRWRGMNVDERLEYDQMAGEDKKRYQSELRGYLHIFNGRMPRMVRRKRQAKGLPKRPKNPFIYYQKEIWTQVRQENQLFTPQEMIKEIAFRWKALTEVLKVPYKLLNKQDNLRYKREMQVFRDQRSDKREQNRILKQNERLIALRALYGK